MKLSRRMYDTEDDFWRLRAFLRDVFVANGYRELSWQVARLEYWRYFINVHIDRFELNEVICIWETPDNRIAAAVIPDGRGNAFLQVHPHYRSADLEMEMLTAAEQCLTVSDEDGKHKLTVWAHQSDDLRKRVLQVRGYTLGDWPEYQFRRCLDEEIPEVRLAQGYTIRSMGDASEIPARSWLSWRVFHPDEPDEKYQGWEWYPDVQRCPLYRRDFDLVALAPDGELAAFCTVWYDDVTRTGYFEPVGTSPDHQRKGLGRAIMSEGLHRLKTKGALFATVAGYSEAARGLYGSVMSPECMVFERWHMGNV